MSAGERAREIARRNALLVAAVLLVAIVAANIASQVRGDTFEAEARVLIEQRDLGAALTGSAAPYVDPRQARETRLVLATAPLLYQRTADATGGRYGSGPDLEEMVSAGGGASDVIVFTATAGDKEIAEGAVQAVAVEYIRFRADLAAAPIRTAREQATRRLAEDSSNVALREKLATLEILETLSAGDATLLDPTTTGSRVSPAPVRDSAVGLLAGLVVALLMVGAREGLNAGIRGFSDAQAALGQVPLAGTVVELPRTSRLISLARPASRHAGAYAVVFTDLYRRLQAIRRPIVAVTSPDSGDGKSTTVANLAVVAARSGHRVLVVDADARMAGLTRLLGLSKGVAGLRDLWSEEDGLPQGLIWEVPLEGEAIPVPAEVDGDTPGLFAIAAGTSTVAWGRFTSALRSLSEHFDLVVIDGPPSLLTPDVAQLSDVCDGIIVVVRSGKTTRGKLRRLLLQIDGWGGPNTIGAILTGAKDRGGHSYYDD